MRLLLSYLPFLSNVLIPNKIILCFKLAAWTVYLADSFYHFLRKLDRQVLLWVEEHGGADAILAVGAVEHIHIDAALATTPEGLIVGQVGEGDREITQLGVHLHHSRTGCQREDLGMRPSLSGERKGKVLDTFCQSDASEVWVNDQT